jgi:DNA repair exonuclease SbcCD ATPase subunit
VHIVILTHGKNDALSIQHVHHHSASATPAERAPSPNVNLLVLDARQMSAECLNEATRKVVEMRAKNGLRHAILLCDKPDLPLLVASIRCGLRDVVSKHIDAAHLRQLLRAADPGLSRRDYRDAIAFLRTFNAFATGEGGSTGHTLARRAEELGRLATTLAEQEKDLADEKDRLARLDQDIRERTRRLDRQIARLQNDSDITPAAPAANTAELDALAQKLEKRSAELDVREKLLNEMQTLLLGTPEGSPFKEHLAPSGNPPGQIG